MHQRDVLPSLVGLAAAVRGRLLLPQCQRAASVRSWVLLQYLVRLTAAVRGWLLLRDA